MLPRCRSEIVVLVTLVSLLFLYGWARNYPQPSLYWNTHNEGKDASDLKLYLTDSDCSRSFPHGFDEIEIAKARGVVGKAPRHDDEHGYMRISIYDGVVRTDFLDLNLV